MTHPDQGFFCLLRIDSAKNSKRKQTDFLRKGKEQGLQGYQSLQLVNTGELGYDRLNGTRKIGASYAKFVVYICRILDKHRTGTKHIVRHMQKSVVQWFVISKFTCIKLLTLNTLLQPFIDIISFNLILEICTKHEIFIIFICITFYFCC